MESSISTPWTHKRILILAKTYPTPSAKYHESVCTAGITDDGQLIRIYPVPFRHLGQDQQYKKFQWLEVDTIKSSDSRPESFKINRDTLELGRFIKPELGSERLQYISSAVSSSKEVIQRAHEAEGVSLGLFEPKEILGVKCKRTEEPGWSEKDRNKLIQDNLFDEPVKLLEKLPYDFSLEYKCDDPNCTGHTMRILDWEFLQAFRNFRQYYKSPARYLPMLKRKYLKMFADTTHKTYLMVGTTMPYYSFVIISILHVKDDGQTVMPLLNF